MVRHRVFLSYHGDDKEAVDAFVNQFDDLEDSFIARGILMPDEGRESHDLGIPLRAHGLHLP